MDVRHLGADAESGDAKGALRLAPPARVEGGCRVIAPWMNGVGITPYAAGQFATFDLPAYAESVISGGSAFALAYGARNVTESE